jgi:hypothetical protein
MPNDLAPAIIRGALTISDFRPISAGAMIGFLDTHHPSGTTFHRCGIFQKDGRVWAAPPSKQVIGRDGCSARRTGKHDTSRAFHSWIVRRRSPGATPSLRRCGWRTRTCWHE